MLIHPTTCNDARRLETRVKERTSHLPPAIEEETRRNSAVDRAKPMKNRTRRNNLHGDQVTYRI
ncbi:hypothetical protein F2Q68_00046176 [Brassica cretica]|uniref:Uncharacterized protein n=2 Tax=Brassica cretica TaxID=69181 RepID=A0A8S9LLA6_BRACR|nr:hypothetical protein F2Q68_00046176 [Brassica cretica]KAF3520356.1 hypothetical protein DY000_02063497 [Brassica cretica]